MSGPFGPDRETLPGRSIDEMALKKIELDEPFWSSAIFTFFVRVCSIMKIVHVIPALTKGGAERVVIDLANGAVEKGNQVTLITAITAPPQLLASRLSREIKLNCIGTRSVRSSYIQILPWVSRNHAWLFDQDIVHCHLTFGSVFGLVLSQMRWLLRRPGPAVVETYHAVGMAIPNADRFVHAMLLKGRDAVAFMADDPYWRRYAARHSKRIIRTIPNGIAAPKPVSRTASERYRKDHAGIPARRRAVVGTVSRLARERRPDLLLESFAIVAHAMGPDVHMLLGGGRR
jgi:glycosyltransferase involved in cell wall biosynthesis